MIEPRYGHQAFVWTTETNSTKIIIYGGKQAAGVFLNGLFVIDTQTLQVQQLATQKRLRGRAFAAGNGMHSHYIIFGGINPNYYPPAEYLNKENQFYSNLFNDVALFHAFPAIPAIQGVASTIDTATQMIYFLGGKTNIQENGHSPLFSSCIFGYNLLGGSWSLIFNPGNCYTSTSHVPQPRAFATAVEYKANLYYFAGSVLQFNSSKSSEATMTFFQDLWQFNPQLNSWTEIKTTGTQPPPRDGHTANILGSKMYIYGGRSCDTSSNSSFECSIDILNFLSDVWSMTCNFSGAVCSWQKVQVDNSTNGSPVPRSFHTAVVVKDGNLADTELGDIWITAGLSSSDHGGVLGDVWILRFPSLPSSPARIASSILPLSNLTSYLLAAFLLPGFYPVNYTNQMNNITVSYISQLLYNRGVLTEEVALADIKEKALKNQHKDNLLVTYVAVISSRQIDMAVQLFEKSSWNALQQLLGVADIELYRVGQGSLSEFEKSLRVVQPTSSGLSPTIIAIIAASTIATFTIICISAILLTWKLMSKRKKHGSAQLTNNCDEQTNSAISRLAYSLDGYWTRRESAEQRESHQPDLSR
eukprot:jgi/Galph1/375/GphlegSOOS_G5104.1